MSDTSPEDYSDHPDREHIERMFTPEEWEIIQDGFDRMDQIDPDDNEAHHENIDRVLEELGLPTEPPRTIRALGMMLDAALTDPNQDRPPLHFGSAYGVAPHGMTQEEWDKLDPLTKMTLREDRTDDPGQPK